MAKKKNYAALELDELEAIEAELIASQQQLTAERADVERKVLAPIRAKALKVQAELDKVSAAKSVARLGPAEREALVAAVGGGA